MSRGLWFAAGAGAGIYAMVRGRRAVEAVSPDGLRDRAGAAVLGLRMLGAEVAAGKAEREAELRAGSTRPAPRLGQHEQHQQHEQQEQHEIEHHPEHHHELEE